LESLKAYPQFASCGWENSGSVASLSFSSFLSQALQKFNGLRVVRVVLYDGVCTVIIRTIEILFCIGTMFLWIAAGMRSFCTYSSHKVLMGYGYFDHSTGGSCPGATIMVFFIRPTFLNSAQ
ncbi:unnamed protein product, partial [Sphagnum troendelagicum]